MNPVFVGAGVALITPFDNDGQIDFDRFGKLIEYQISNKTDAIIVCGTTGEGSTLSIKERLSLFSYAAEKINGRVPLIAGTGSNSTFFTLDLGKQAEKEGIDAHLTVTPYYNKTSQKGLIKHYSTLADSFQKPVILYNVPSRTGVNIMPETYRELSKHKNIAAVKEADPDISKLNKAIAACENNLDFYIGNDDLISSGVYLGCKGVISVLSNIMPEFTHNLTAEALRGNIKQANEMQRAAVDIIDALFCDVNPIPVKYAMKCLGVDTGFLRGPLCETDCKKREHILESLIRHKVTMDI